MYKEPLLKDILKYLNAKKESYKSQAEFAKSHGASTPEELEASLVRVDELDRIITYVKKRINPVAKKSENSSCFKRAKVKDKRWHIRK